MFPIIVSNQLVNFSHNACPPLGLSGGGSSGGRTNILATGEESNKGFDRIDYRFTTSPCFEKWISGYESNGSL